RRGVKERRGDWISPEILFEDRGGLVRRELRESHVLRLSATREMGPAGCPDVVNPANFAVRRHQPATAVVNHERDRRRVRPATSVTHGREQVRRSHRDSEPEQHANERVERLAPAAELVPLLYALPPI